MSRVIVKDLPRYLAEDRLREHFAKQGEVTDVRLMRTAKGQSRRFAYIGYKSEEEALKAITYFNNTFIDTSRIVVEQARARNDPSLPKPMGMSGIDAANGAAAQRGMKGAEAAPRHLQQQQAEKAADTRLQEFLEVMQPRIKAKAWANEDGRMVDARPVRVVAVPNKKPGGQGMVMHKVHVKFDGDDGDDGHSNGERVEKHKKDVKEEEEDEDEEEYPDVIPETATTAHDSSVSNMDYLRSKMVMASELDETTTEAASKLPTSEKSEDASKDATSVDGATETISQLVIDKPSESMEDQIMDTGRLFLRNLAYTCTEDDLRSTFAPYGPLAEVQVPIDRETKKAKGFAYITYVLPEHAVKAYRALDAQPLYGRLLHVIPAREKARAEAQDDGHLSVKQAKEKKRKAQAGSDFNWNTLYMNSDAVMDAIADKLGVTKAEILDPSAENMAVRMALAETQVINDTKGYLEQHGISLEAFNKKERSDTVILVKNIPHGTTEEQMHDLFSKFGELGRVIVPPAQTIAVIEFLEPTEARAAFKNLAYSRYKASLLYLEKAPGGIFTHGYHESQQAATTNAKHVQRQAKVEQLLGAAPSTAPTNAEADDSDALSTLFVKNLSFSTTEETLRQVFSPVGPLRKVTIRRKKDPKRPGQLLSMGFGFVEFGSDDAAKRAVHSLQGFVVDGHALQLKVSQQDGGDTRPAGASSKGSTKLVVRNIPFEATRKDLLELFSAYGQVKTVRLPKKFSGGHRGFAFIEFLGQQEAKQAMKHLANTHLYGRHLVIESAEDVDDIDVMRKRVDAQYSQLSSAEASAKKRRRLALEGEEGDEMDEA